MGAQGGAEVREDAEAEHEVEVSFPMRRFAVAM